MKNRSTFWATMGALLLLLPLRSFGQCNNNLDISYYDSNGIVQTQRITNGSSGSTVPVCPTAGATYELSGSSTSDATLSWARVITKGATTAGDVVTNIGSPATVVAGTRLTVPLTFTSQTIYRFRSDATAKCSTGKDFYAYITLSPALELTATGANGICAGSSTTLTASGSSSGTYTWSANGTTIPGKTGATLTVSPGITTTYMVTTATASPCNTSSQQVTIPVFGLTIEPSAPTICSGQSTTLMASYNGNSATYQWFVKGQSMVLSTANTLPVAPTSTTIYQVVATTADCSGTLTKETTITVGAPTVTTSPTSATICSGGGGAVVLQALSNNPAATFSWAPGAGLSATTGATVTATPAATTTYTVTATTPCGTVTSQVLVSVAAATFALSPASPAAVCAGNSLTLTASCNITNATYKWYRTTNPGTILSTSPTYGVSPASSTTYRVLTSTSCGNNSTQDVTVNVNTNPVTVSPASTTVRSGESTTLTASGGTTYTWSQTVDGATQSIASTSASIVVSPSKLTTYTVTATNISTGCNTAVARVGVGSPLPVELIAFEASLNAESVLLTWATASEKNSAYFMVERGLDGRTFTQIGRLEGAGNTSTRTNYHLSDATSTLRLGSVVYYRLQQVDMTGETAYSPVRAVQLTPNVAKGQTMEAVILPNPSSEAATVAFQAVGTAEVVITIVNVLGQTVATKTEASSGGPQTVTLSDSASLPSGLYYLTIRQGVQQQVLRLYRQ